MNTSCWKSIKNILGIFICIFFGQYSSAQDNWTSAKNNPLLDHLFRSKHENIDVSFPGWNQKFIEVENPNLNSYAQSLLKNREGLFLFVNASGRIYEAKKVEGDSMYFARIDATHFYGHNNGSVYFSYRDTIYNFGGFGYWNTNGHLRYFSKFNKEWNIKALDKEVKAVKMLYQLDSKNGCFYFTGDLFNPAEKEKKPSFRVTQLDLNKEQNIDLGVLDKTIVDYINLNPFQPIMVQIPAWNRTLLAINVDKIYLLDFKGNRFYKLTNKGIRDYFFGNAKGLSVNNCFAEDSTIHFTLTNDTGFQLNSFRISKNDFEQEGAPLYYNPIDWLKVLAISGLGFFFLAIPVFFLWRIRRMKAKIVELTEKSMNTEIKDDLGFQQFEIELILAIHEGNLKGRIFTVDEINTHLGIQRKALEVQKKIRTETINRINHKFKLLSESTNVLIERVRSVEDRRYYMYTVSDQNLEKLKSFI